MRNYQIEAGDKIGQGGPHEKVRANIAAIRTLKLIEEESREATTEEKRLLVGYVGWGAFAQAVFDANPYSTNAQTWQTERQALSDLLTTAEWDSARASTTNAHYTSEAAIRGVWGALDHLGFSGGRALEPAAGIGHFIGLTPERLREDVSWTGVELDQLSGRIAKTLYGGADIRVQGFETATWPDGFFDLAIGNVPFGNYALRDPRYRPMSIHDYFFVKSLDKLRPGGISAMITSSYTLDKQSAAARREMAKRADFLGAIRLPGGNKGAFAANAGTQVTTDIIFLRRRTEGEPAGDQTWLNVAEITTPDGPAVINAYYAANPRMMLGEMRLQGTMRGANEPVLLGSTDGIEERIAAAARAMPANAFIAREAARREPQAEIDAEPSAVKEGAFYLKDGQIYRKLLGVGQPQEVSKAEFEKLSALIDVRDIVNELLARHAPGEAKARDELRSQLNASYDAFVARYGPINKTTTTTTARRRNDGTAVVISKMPNLAAFRADPDAMKVAAIETYAVARDAADKAAIFVADIVAAPAEPEITGPSDALAVSLNRTGQVDMAFIAWRLGLAEDEAVEALGAQVYLDPAGDVWRTADDYLSGDVVRKLNDARAASVSDRRYKRNVGALEFVQPIPLTRVDIKVLFGAPWVPAEVYTAFCAEVLSMDGVELALNPVTKRWQFLSKPSAPLSAQAQFGTARSGVAEILDAAMNSTEIRITDRNPDPSGGPIYNPAASEESNAKVKALRDLFSGAPEAGVDAWIWQDEARAHQIETLYNASFNRLTPTVYDGSHLGFPGLARVIATNKGEVVPFALRPHQANAVWRIVKSGNALLDHVVGAGKTYTMIAAGMEQKRLGLIQRPMYVVPNHMLEQFSREFLQAYPGAKLLLADEESMSRAKRKEFTARVAAEKWDAVIIRHDSFGRIPMSDAAYKAFISEEIEQLDDFKARAAAEEGKDTPTVKELEKAKKRLETRLLALVNKEAKDDGVTFEELGVDFLFVDEAHAFKNLSFRTRHARVKGITADTEAQRATDLFLKIRYLDGLHPGRAAVFATGTPVSNTMAEKYTMQRYLQLDLLKEYGIDEFDAWAATFGEIVSQVELAPSGKGFRSTRAFSKFVNIPELITLYSRMADTQTAEMLDLPRPRLRDGAVKVVEAAMSPAETDYMESLVARAEAMKGRRPEKGADNMLKIMSEGLQLATDMRLIDPGAAFNPDGKVAHAVDNIHRIWREGEEPALVQIVFLDMGVPGSKAKARAAPGAEPDVNGPIRIAGEETGEADMETSILAGRFNLYEDIRQRLMAKGVPREQIAFIHEADSDAKKAALFSAVRQGEVRVLLGSTAKMGVGTNVQERLIAMHHIDAPWKPADLEQRDGRILRQGNLNPEVEIYRYVTRHSLDAYRWQTLARKASFIAQLRAGARGVRSAEDIDSPLPEAEAIKAAATGDSRIMEHAELTKELRELEASRRAHERSAGAARMAHGQTLKRIEHLRQSIVAVGEDAAHVADLSGERFRVTLDLTGAPVVVAERKRAGEQMIEHLTRTGASMRYGERRTETLGSLSGFAMRIEIAKTDRLAVAPFLEGRRTYEHDPVSLSGGSDPVSLMRRFERLMRAAPQALAQYRNDLVKAEEDLPRLAKQLEVKPFSQLARLNEVKARVAELVEALSPKAQPATPVSAPEPDADVIQHKTPFRAAGRRDNKTDIGKESGVKKKNAYVDQVAETLITQLEQGTAPWTKPWGPGERFAPYNPTTGNEYHGVNAMWLLTMAQIKGYGDARWMTYKQAQKVGAQVNTGEKGAIVQYWKFEGDELVAGPNGQMMKERVRYERPQIFSAAVFNAAQIDGLPPAALRPVPPEWERHERAEAIMRNLGAAIRHLPGDAAYYNRVEDQITLPERSQFPDADSFYETALHETAHASGHPSRLNRDVAHPFGSEGYSREELRAEIATLMLGEQLGVGHNPKRCASYVDSWIKALRDDPREIFRAASDAEKIVSFMRGLEHTLDHDLRQTDAEQRPQSDALSAKIDQRTSQTQPSASPELETGETFVRAPVLIPAENELMRNSSERVYLAVPYVEKNEAKALGACFDGQAKCWYAPPGADLTALKPWLSEHTDFRTIGHDGDTRQAFAQALREAGLEFNGLPEMDGRLHRVRVAGDGRAEKSGWYRGHADGLPNGKFGNHKTSSGTISWKSQTPTAALSVGERARLRAENAQRLQERERREEAAYEAALGAISARLAKAEPAPADHAYLARKGVGAHGVFLGEKNNLLIPVRDLDGRLMGAQGVGPDGSKRFAPGGRVQGGCHAIGDLARGETVLIAEGYATGAELHEATGLPIAVAFNAGNLEAVAKAVRERWPEKRILIAGDDDRHKERNVGREKAEAAAKAAGGFALFPKFGAGERGTDFNDLGQTLGKAEVLKQVQEGLASAERHNTIKAKKAQMNVAQEEPVRAQGRGR